MASQYPTFVAPSAKLSQPKAYQKKICEKEVGRNKAVKKLISGSSNGLERNKAVTKKTTIEERSGSKYK